MSNALDRYLTENGIPTRQFASLVGTSESSISRLRRGLQVPSLDLMRKIDKATGKRVRPNDFLNVSQMEAAQ